MISVLKEAKAYWMGVLVHCRRYAGGRETMEINKNDVSLLAATGDIKMNWGRNNVTIEVKDERTSEWKTECEAEKVSKDRDQGDASQGAPV